MQSQIIWFIIIIYIFFTSLWYGFNFYHLDLHVLMWPLKPKLPPLLILLERIEQNRIILRIISISR